MAARPRRRESDAVCVALARMVAGAAEDGSEQAQVQNQESSTTDAAFRRRMRRLTLNRVKFPTPEEEEDRIYLTTGQMAMQLSAGADSKQRMNKRSRADLPQDLVEVTEQRSRNNTPASTPPEEQSEERPPLTKEVRFWVVCAESPLFVDALSSCFIVDGGPRVGIGQATRSAAAFGCRSCGG